MPLFKIITVFLILLNLAQAGSNCRNHVKNSPPLRPRVLILSATDNPDSKSVVVAKQVFDLAKNEGMDAEFISLLNVNRGELTGDQYFNKSLQFRIENHFKFQQADAVLIVYPEYDGNVAGVYYQYMNHMRANLTGKTMGVIGVSSGFAGGRQAADLMAGPLLHRKATLVGESRVFIPGIEKYINTDKTQIGNKELIRRMKDALHSLVKYALDRKMIIQLQTDLALKSSSSSEIFFNSGISVRGTLEKVEYDSSGRIQSIQWKGFPEIREKSKLIKKLGSTKFQNGFKTPFGNIVFEGKSIPLSKVNLSDFESLGLYLNSDRESQLQFASGTTIKGVLKNVKTSKDGNPQILTFEDANGTFDIIVSENLESLKLGPQNVVKN